MAKGNKSGVVSAPKNSGNSNTNEEINTMASENVQNAGGVAVAEKPEKKKRGPRKGGGVNYKLSNNEILTARYTCGDDKTKFINMLSEFCVKKGTLKEGEKVQESTIMSRISSWRKKGVQVDKFPGNQSINTDELNALIANLKKKAGEGEVSYKTEDAEGSDESSEAASTADKAETEVAAS